MAGRIPQSFIDDLLDRADIVEVIDRRVKLKKTGKNYSARCPFHDEKTPSFSVNPEKQFYYCFGCGAGGNSLGFLMDYENMEFPRAVESLADACGMQVPREESNQKVDKGQRELYPLLEEAASYYQKQLRSHPERDQAVAYLKGRGLTGQVAKQYDMGFAPPGWDNLLSTLGTSEERKLQLQQAGMVIKNEDGRVYDRFRNRVVFPIRDQRGRVIAFGGRVLGDDKPKYLNSPETEIFHKGRELYGLYHAQKLNRQLQRIVVVEGYMDVIALGQHGITWAVATLGTATSTAHLEKIYRRCSEVVFCFDGDEAGRKAATRALESALPAMQDGRQAKFLFLPEGEDPDTLVRDRGAEHFLQLVEQAMPLEQYLFESVGQGLDIDSMDGRARLSKLAAPLLSKLPNGVFRQLMFQALAERTGLEQGALQALVDIPAPTPVPAQKQAQAPPESSKPRQRPVLHQQPQGFSNLAQSAMALLLHKPDIAQQAGDYSALKQLAGTDIALLVEVLELLQRRPDSTTAMILGHWYGSDAGEVLNQLAGQERLIPAAGIEKQFSDTIELLIQHPKRQILGARVDKLRDRNYADISDLEKLEIVRALQEKQQLDQKRGK
ncbi:DNA primase [Halieaceae bacterium IMCC14734]|uniref:DNA primase n=1 Tax=Candidatus Litorirhabdus singularis TaxID=2518993 RepID=A0ABT3TM59_9GAMM|nr:DNA primase [Candidatus Litorirhabdus singularis]MCX2983370.1 DNA primase [Candidatus Litorirhabdus singularis]